MMISGKFVTFDLYIECLNFLGGPTYVNITNVLHFTSFASSYKVRGPNVVTHLDGFSGV